MVFVEWVSLIKKTLCTPLVVHLNILNILALDTDTAVFINKPMFILLALLPLSHLNSPL